jgi:Holliday junction DNA helicase RuvA
MRLALKRKKIQHTHFSQKRTSSIAGTLPLVVHGHRNMIAYLEGNVLRVHADLLILKTRDGVGYAVHAPQSLLAGCRPEEALEVHVHTHVREDEITLYGFRTPEDCALFEMLIKTSGVGPRIALAALSTLSAPELVSAVQRGDAEAFSKVPGIGKKTATKLCLDMRDQLKKHPLPGLQSGTFAEVSLQAPSADSDGVLSALKNMGFAEREVLPVLQQLDPEAPFEERFKKALSLLNPLR